MLSLRARLVLPIDQPPIDGGVVTIDGARIVAVGKSAFGEEVQDLGDVTLLPGLVNAHTHLEYSLLARPIGRPGMAFPDWIRRVVAYKRQQTEPTNAAVAAGLQQSLRYGVTSLGEIASRGWSAEALAEEARVTAFEELIGLKELPIVDCRLPIGLDKSRMKFGLSPHAPYTVHPELLSAAVKLAGEHDWPVAMHLAESREELVLLRTGGGPFRDLLQELGVWNPAVFAASRRPLDYLKQLSAAPRSLVIHGNYLDDEEINFVAAHADRMSVVYCPRTHAYFGHELHPLPKLLTAGAIVAVGTDGRGSNPDLDLWAELRLVAQFFPALPPESILRLGTLDAARALGIEEQVGSLTPGKQADLLALPLTGTQSPDLSQLLTTDFPASERHVMCAGRWAHGPGRPG